MLKANAATDGNYSAPLCIMTIYWPRCCDIQPSYNLLFHSLFQVWYISSQRGLSIWRIRCGSTWVYITVMNRSLLRMLRWRRRLCGNRLARLFAANCRVRTFQLRTELFSLFGQRTKCVSISSKGIRMFNMNIFISVVFTGVLLCQGISKIDYIILLFSILLARRIVYTALYELFIF